MSTDRRKCTICAALFLTENESGQSFCEKYLLTFLLELDEKLDDDAQLAAHFNNSLFADDESINRISCTGLTLMHVNVLGGRDESPANESDEATGAFTPPYDQTTAARVCRVLLQHGASPHGNAIYEMRPLHIAIRREWTEVSRLLLDAGANPNIPEKDFYASRPMDIAVVNDDPETVELLHDYGASLHGVKSMFYLSPLTEAFIRGYFDVFKVLLERGAQPVVDLHWNTFRSFGTKMFESGPKGRRHFIQLMFDHGAEIQQQFKLCPIRIESNGTTDFTPYFTFSCNPICIADLDNTMFIKWMCECRSLKELCRLALRRYCFRSFHDGYRRLCALKEQTALNDHLIQFLMFRNSV